MKWLQRLALVVLLIGTTWFDLMLASWSSTSYGLWASLIVITVSSLVLELQFALRITLMQAFLLDLFSPSPFGAYLISGFIAVVLIQVIQATWLKQATVVHRLIISMIGTASANVVFFEMHRLVYYWQWTNQNVTSGIEWLHQLIWYGLANVVIIAIIKYRYHYERPISSLH